MPHLCFLMIHVKLVYCYIHTKLVYDYGTFIHVTVSNYRKRKKNHKFFSILQFGTTSVCLFTLTFSLNE